MSGRPSLGALRRFVGAAVVHNPLVPAGSLLAIVAVAWVLQASQPINHDLAWLLIATRRLLAGAAIYRHDVIEVNPPLILGLLAPAVETSQLFGISLITSVRVFTVLLAIGSAVLSGRLLDRVLGESGVPLRRTLQVSFLYASLVFVDADFGQREHFILILGMPYLCLAAARARGSAIPRSEAAVAGLLGGVAFAVKPTFALVLLALEGALALRRRSVRVWWRIDLAAALAVGAVYLVTVLWATPGYFELVFPLAVDGYWIYRRPLQGLLRVRDLAVIALGLLALLQLRRDERLRELGAVWFLASVGFYAMSLLQGTGWSYTVIAFQGVSVPLLVLGSCSLLRGLGDPPAAPIGTASRCAGAGVALLALFVALAAQPGLVHTLRRGGVWRAGQTDGPIRVLQTVIDNHAGGGSVYFMTPVLRGPFPTMIYSRAEWASRFSCLWLVPAILRARAGDSAAPARLTPGRLDALERYLVGAVVEDLSLHQPELIFVDRRRMLPGYGGFELDILEFFKRDPEFARIWSGYRLAGDIPPYTIALRAPPRVARGGPGSSARGRSTGSGWKTRSSSASPSVVAKIR